MATIIHRGPHQWQAKVRRKGYPPVTKTFETKAGATRWARLVESEMDHGAYVSREEAENTTFAEALTRYAKEVTPRKKGVRQERDRIEALEKLDAPVVARALEDADGLRVAQMGQIGQDAARGALRAIDDAGPEAVPVLIEGLEAEDRAGEAIGPRKPDVATRDRSDQRRAGLFVPALELRQVAARRILEHGQPILDRGGIAVMSAGRLVETFARGDWTEERVMQALFSQVK